MLSMHRGSADLSTQSLALSKSCTVKSMQLLIKYTKDWKFWVRRQAHSLNFLAHFKHQTSVFKEVGCSACAENTSRKWKVWEYRREVGGKLSKQKRAKEICCTRGVADEKCIGGSLMEALPACLSLEQHFHFQPLSP